MRGLLTILKHKSIRSSAQSSLKTSSQIPTSGIAALDNSQGLSQTAGEFLETVWLALGEVTGEGDWSTQLRAQVQRLDEKVANYANCSLDFCTKKQVWNCTEEEANLISLAWNCSESVYNAILPSEQTIGAEVKVEFSIPASTFGSTKATRFTNYTPEFEKDESGGGRVLVIAVKGSASKYDHVVNLNTEARVASKLFVQGTGTDLQLYAHAGFLNSAMKLLPQILERVSKHLKENPKADVMFTGHSAGGAVATLLHLAMLSRFGNTEAKFSCLTFGAPPSIKMPSEKDQRFLKKLTRHSATTNFINEYDLVTRLDSSYSHSLAQIYALPLPEEISSPTQTEEEEEEGDSKSAIKRQGSIWKCPPPDLQHVGELVVLRVEIPTFEKGLEELVGTRLSAWQVTAEELAELVFCRLTVHKREAYKPRIELLRNGRFNGGNGWDSSK